MESPDGRRRCLDGCLGIQPQAHEESSSTRRAYGIRIAYISPMANPATPMPEEPTQDEIELAWREEIGRRVAELDAGRARLVDGDQVFAELRKLIADHHG